MNKQKENNTNHTRRTKMTKDCCVTHFIIKQECLCSIFTFLSNQSTHLVLTHLGLCFPVSLALLDHSCLTGSLTQCPIISPQVSSKFCVCADYTIGYYIFSRKLCCYGNKLAAIFERGTLTAST